MNYANLSYLLLNRYNLQILCDSLFTLWLMQVPEEGTDENGLVDGILPPQPMERVPTKYKLLQILTWLYHFVWIVWEIHVWVIFTTYGRYLTEPDLYEATNYDPNSDWGLWNIWAHHFWNDYNSSLKYFPDTYTLRWEYPVFREERTLMAISTRGSSERWAEVLLSIAKTWRGIDEMKGQSLVGIMCSHHWNKGLQFIVP